MASISNTASEDNLLRARVEDAVRLCEIRGHIFQRGICHLRIAPRGLDLYSGEHSEKQHRIPVRKLNRGLETNGSTRTSPFETARNAIGVMLIPAPPPPPKSSFSPLVGRSEPPDAKP